MMGFRDASVSVAGAVPTSAQRSGRFACMSCGYEANADLNTARHSLAGGHGMLGSAEPAQPGLSVKQEPAKATTLGPALV